MKHNVVPVLACVIIAFGARGWSQEEATENPPKKPATEGSSTKDDSAQLAAIVDSFQKAQQDFSAKYRAAKDDDERTTILADRPRAETWAPKLLDLARRTTDASVEFEALSWIVRRCRQGDALSGAIGILARSHIRSSKIEDLLPSLAYSPTPAVDGLLAKLREEHPERATRGKACFYLGLALKRRASTVRSLREGDEELVARYRDFYGKELVESLGRLEAPKLEKRSEALFEEVVQKFADVEGRSRKLGVTAERQLFEMRNLAIGKVAPEIEGEDIDGKNFKLSDYRGKVVVLDFWGTGEAPVGPCTRTSGRS